MQTMQDSKTISSFMNTQHHLLPFASAWVLADSLLFVLPPVLFSPLDGVEFFSLDFTGFLDSRGHVSVSSDSPDLWHVRVASFQCI